MVTERIPAGFKQQRGVQYNGGRWVSLVAEELQILHHGRLNSRVRDVLPEFQVGAVFLRKYDSGNFGPVQRPVFPQYGGSPASVGGVDHGAFFQYGMAGGIGVEDDRAQLSKFGSHRTLATGHTTDQSDYNHKCFFARRVHVGRCVNQPIQPLIGECAADIQLTDEQSLPRHRRARSGPMTAATTNAHPMYQALSVYAAFGLCSAVLLLILSAQVMVEGVHRSARTFGVFCMACAAWALADTFALLGPNETWSRFWIVTVRQTAVCVTAVAWVWFASAYTLAPGSAIGRRLVAFYFVVALIFAAIGWMPFREQLIYAYALEQHEYLWHPVGREGGTLHVPYLVFMFSACALGLTMLLLFLFRAGPDSRWQVLLVLLGTGISILVSALSTLGYLGSRALDKSIYSMPVMVLLLFFACFRFGFLKSSPVLLRALMTAIPNPILVLDRNCHLVEANLAGLTLLSQESTTPGKPILLPCPDLRSMLDGSTELAHFLFTDFLAREC